MYSNFWMEKLLDLTETILTLEFAASMIVLWMSFSFSSSLMMHFALYDRDKRNSKGIYDFSNNCSRIFVGIESAGLEDFDIFTAQRLELLGLRILINFRVPLLLKISRILEDSILKDDEIEEFGTGVI